MKHGTRPAAVIGSGPNGLAAAVTLARAGIPVTVFEAADQPGGGTRTKELITPGVWHDVCSAIHPMALATGFFREFELERRMAFAIPEVSYANPLPGHKRVPLAYRDLDATVAGLGADGAAYGRLFRPILEHFTGVVEFATGGTMLRWPRDLRAAAVLAARVLETGTQLSRLRFREGAAPALLQGVIAHSTGRMPSLATAAVGLVLGATAHQRGWPVPIGGSQAISTALLADLVAHGGKLETGHRVRDLAELRDYGVTLFDTSARGMAQIIGDAFPSAYTRKLEQFRYASGACKVDLILSGPIPWTDPAVAQTATVHLGGTRAQVQHAEREISQGYHAEHPVMLLAQPTSFDPHRNPSGVHTVWAYVHVPHGSTRDLREQVISRIEEFAPGVRDLVVDSAVITAAQFETYNPNYHGGDFSAGALNLQQLIARPVLSRDPWRTPATGVYLASSSAAPGPGVHGLCGWYAAQSALRHEYGVREYPYLGVSNRVTGAVRRHQ